MDNNLLTKYLSQINEVPFNNIDIIYYKLISDQGVSDHVYVQYYSKLEISISKPIYDTTDILNTTIFLSDYYRWLSEDRVKRIQIIING